MAKLENSQNNSPQIPASQPSAPVQGLRMALLAGFFLAALLIAALTFRFVRDLVTSWEMTGLAGAAIQDNNAQTTPAPGEAPVIDSLEEPLQPAAGPTPPPWDGAARVTVLVMGLDARDWETGEGPPRTDTMILLTIDPLTQTAGMLSIPRDMWVNIPGGFKYGRINTAYQLGEAYQLPGGGPQLAMETVEELLGVPIDYYAQIDFEAFVQFIDELGGVRVEVPEKIVVDPLGDDNTKTIKPGVQVLPGDLALAYARARKTEGGDFDRAQRTQQVIMGIRHRILKFDMLPTLIAKSGTLYNQLSDGVHTNLTLDQVIRLAWMAVQIPEANIKQGIISPPNQVTLETNSDGTQQVLKPITDQIRLLRDEIFTNTGPASPAMANMDAAQLMQAEGARVAVLNGSVTAGLAAQTSDYLKSLGVNVTETGNAQTASTYTRIIFYTGKPYTVKFLADLMAVDATNRIFYNHDPASQVDIAIIVGDDWANTNPMP